MSDVPPIGIVAGGGGVPLELAASLETHGRRVHIVGISGFADPAIGRYPHTIVGLGQLGRLLSTLHGEGCREIVIVGALERPDLTRLRLDWGALRNLPAVLSLMRGGDDSLLRRIIRFFEGHGFQVSGLGDLAPELLASEGRLAGPELSSLQQAAVQRARALLTGLSRFDVGQAVVARADGVLAVEASEGTRRMLARLAASGGCGADAVLVKLPKVGQEMRIDLPTIGAGTIEEAAAAGLSGIAVAAGAAVVAERAQLVSRAEALGIAVIGIPAGDQPVPAAVSSTAVIASDEAVALDLAATVLARAWPGAAEVGAIVRQAHPLAVEIDGIERDAWLRRLETLPRGWLPVVVRRSGALAIAFRAAPDAAAIDRLVALASRAQRRGLAGIVIAVPEVAGIIGALEPVAKAVRRVGLAWRVRLGVKDA